MVVALIVDVVAPAFLWLSQGAIRRSAGSHIDMASARFACLLTNRQGGPLTSFFQYLAPPPKECNYKNNG